MCVRNFLNHGLTSQEQRPTVLLVCPLLMNVLLGSPTPSERAEGVSRCGVPPCPGVEGRTAEVTRACSGRGCLGERGSSASRTAGRHLRRPGHAHRPGDQRPMSPRWAGRGRGRAGGAGGGASAGGVAASVFLVRSLRNRSRGGEGERPGVPVFLPPSFSIPSPTWRTLCHVSCVALATTLCPWVSGWRNETPAGTQ